MTVANALEFETKLMMKGVWDIVEMRVACGIVQIVALGKQ